MSETALRAAVVTAMNSTGLCRVWGVHAGKVRVRGGWMQLSPEGTPDVCGYMRDGRFIGIELKVPGHRTHKERAEKQRAFQEDIVARGGVAAQVESVTEAINVLWRAVNQVRGGKRDQDSRIPQNT